MATSFDTVGQQRIVGTFRIAASETTPGRRAFRIAVQPFDDATGERLGLGFLTRLSALKLDDAGLLIKEDLPVTRGSLGRPRRPPRCFVSSARYGVI